MCSTSPVCSFSETSFTRIRWLGVRVAKFQPAGVKDLSATGGIKRRAVEDDGNVPSFAADGHNASFEFSEEGVGVVEALGQGDYSGQRHIQ